METWKSSRAIEAQRQAEIEAEKQRQFAIFDGLADLFHEGVITMEQLREAFATPQDKLYIPGGEVERQ